ncbi:hypothetical protein BV20DRAFT_218558 [Pilatotrama ljubarskyi]|nr:hypothetical protein BV20DRAFT_218558 [Pilatotrama ljubarskyi]
MGIINMRLACHGPGTATEEIIPLDSDADPSEAKLASVIIILPSMFSGGAARFQRASCTTTYHTHSENRGEIVALAWRPGTTMSSDAIAYGYRLTLSFDVVSSSGPRSSLPVRTELLAKLNNLLATWHRSRRSTTPSKLLYLLHHIYSQADIRQSTLRGRDSRLTTILETFAAAYGFNMGLTILTSQQVGRNYDSWEEDEQPVVSLF